MSDPQPPSPEHPHDDEDDDHSRRNAVIAMIVVIVLVAGSLWLTTVLAWVSRIQDCVMSGRRNCAPVDAPPR